MAERRGYVSATTGNAASTLSTKTTHTKYFQLYLESLDIGEDLHALLRRAKGGDQDAVAFLNDPETYQNFGGYLIEVAKQLKDPKKNLSADHARNIFSTITTTVSDAFPQHPTWQKKFVLDMVR